MEHKTLQILSNTIMIKKADAYTRSSDGVKATDRETGKPLAMHNIFIVEAGHRMTDKDGRRAIDIQSGGEGPPASARRCYRVRLGI